MTPTSTKKKVSFLSIALGSLIVTSLSTGSAEAAWSGPRCKTQCSKTVIGNNTKKLNECATNCDNATILDALASNCAKLDPKHKENVKNILTAELNTKKKDQEVIETEMGHLRTQGKGLSKSMTKKQQDQLRALDKKQDKLLPDLNALPKQIEQCGGTAEAPERPNSDLPSGEETKAPERPTRGPRPARPASKSPSDEETKAPERRNSRLSRSTSKGPAGEAPSRPTSGSHISKPPSDLPPSLPPSDLPPTLPDDKPEPQVKKPGGPVPPTMGQNPRAILKAELLAQNPGKKSFEIDTMLKEKLAADHPGKSAGEINQHLKDEQDAKYPGKSHAEILDSLKAAGPQTPSGSSAITSSGSTKEPSPQAQRKTTTGAKPEGGSLTDALSGLGDNPQARLKKFDPEAEAKRKAAAQANQPGDMFSELKGALGKRRVDVAGTISAKDKETLDNLLNKDKKTPEEVRALIETEWDLFDDHESVEEELKKLEKNK